MSEFSHTGFQGIPSIQSTKGRLLFKRMVRGAGDGDALNPHSDKEKYSNAFNVAQKANMSE
jgi:hypothetical protein